MKKIIVIIVLAILVGFATYKIFFQYTQSTPKELKVAFNEAIKVATALQEKNPYKNEKEELVQWEISISGECIEFRQHPSWDFHYANEYKQYMKLSLKGDKIILKQYDFANYSTSLGENASLSTFGAAYDKIREFKSAKDFSKKFTKFAEDLAKFKTGEYEYKSLVLSDYYPACTWRNWKLSNHDDEKDYKYPY